MPSLCRRPPEATCTTWQQQTTNTNTGTLIHQNSPNTPQSSSSSSHSQTSHPHSQSTLHVQTPTLNINAPPFPSNLHQAAPPPLIQNHPSTNYHTNQQHIHTPPTQPLNAQFPQSFNPHVPPPYFPQYPPTNSPSKCENQQRSRINKAFEKIPRFDGTNPNHCFDWLEQTKALVNEHQGWIYREELVLNCGTSMSKMIHTLPQGATNQNIKDTVLRNHSNLRTVLQRSNMYHQLHQKPNEALQMYNTRYALFFNLAYPELELDNPLSRMHCIHYASSLYGKLGDVMTGRFNQDLPENLQMAFKKATNFEPQIITKQSINNRKIHEVNHIDIRHEEEIEINEAHVRNPNYKGKNYDLNYAQNRSKMTNNTSNTPSHQNNTTPSYGSSGQHNTNNPGYNYNNSNHQEKLVNVSITLHGPVSKEQLYKIQEVLRHPSQYRNRIKPEDRPVKGKYANAFNKFCPKKVEVNEATVEEAIKYGQFLKKNEEDIAEAIDIYRTLGNKTFYGPEEDTPDQ